ncbi:MAG: hypothetical protein ABIN94_00365 [Ferruginibacter sp.]
MSLQFRMHVPDDVNALVQFWNENSGWDQIDRNEWERRFFNTPFGNASVALAQESVSREIIAQLIFIPTMVCVDGSGRKASRPFAMVVKQDKKPAGYLKLVDMIYKMYTHAVDHFKQQDFSLIHMIPDPRWSGLLRFLPALQVGSYPLCSRSLSMEEKFNLPDGYTVKTISADDKALDSLWNESSELYGCSVLRNSSSLPWKTSLGHYQLSGIYKNNELKGMVSSVPKLKDKQWLICDMVTSDAGESLTATLQAAFNHALEYKASLKEGEELNKVAILTTPFLERTVTSLGFVKDNYKFPMLVHLLDNRLTKKQVAPERWYASAND